MKYLPLLLLFALPVQANPHIDHAVHFLERTDKFAKWGVADLEAVLACTQYDAQTEKILVRKAIRYANTIRERVADGIAAMEAGDFMLAKSIVNQSHENVFDADGNLINNSLLVAWQATVFRVNSIYEEIFEQCPEAIPTMINANRLFALGWQQSDLALWHVTDAILFDAGVIQ